MRSKGLSIVGLTSFVRERFGWDALAQVLEGLVDDPALFVDSLEPFRWYPFETLAQLFEVVVKELGDGDLDFAREIGTHVGRFHQKLVPEDFLRIADPNLAATMNRFWLLYHDQGRVAVIEDGKDFILRIVCPVKLTTSYMHGIAGWMENIMNTLGMKNYAVVSSDEPMELRILRGEPKKTLNNNSK